MAIEEPKYSVIQKNDTFEVRKYEPYLVAQTEVTGKSDEMGRKAFKILFDYISGKNQKNSKITMTAPVIQEDDQQQGQKIAMTVPVLQEMDRNNSKRATFSFVMPKEFTLQTLPKPLDSRITIKKILQKTVAVRRYSGTWAKERYEENKSILLKALKDAKIETIGEAKFARYNSPFSLWIFRRNEVMIEIVEKI